MSLIYEPCPDGLDYAYGIHSKHQIKQMNRHKVKIDFKRHCATIKTLRKDIDVWSLAYHNLQCALITYELVETVADIDLTIVHFFNEAETNAYIFEEQAIAGGNAVEIICAKFTLAIVCHEFAKYAGLYYPLLRSAAVRCFDTATAVYEELASDTHCEGRDASHLSLFVQQASYVFYNFGLYIKVWPIEPLHVLTSMRWFELSLRLSARFQTLVRTESETKREWKTYLAFTIRNHDNLAFCYSLLGRHKESGDTYCMAATLCGSEV
jgi:hypothetical protein